LAFFFAFWVIFCYRGFIGVIVELLLKIRIDWVKELLDFTDKPIAENAEISRFQDQNYFAHTVKKITGMSPSQCRRTDKA